MADTVKRVVILPVRDNDGESLKNEREVFERFLVGVVGGYSCMPQHGEWRDGTTHKTSTEFSLIYTVLCDETQDKRILRALPALRLACRQAVLLTYRSIVDATFIE